MTLGVILAIGESLSDLKSKGQLKRLIDYNIQKYSHAFNQVFIFSYEAEKNFNLPKNCQLIANTSRLHRYPYSILMPIIKRKEITRCDVLRGLQLSGGIPAVIAKIIYGKRFIINYGYDYSKFAKIEDKNFQSFLYKLIQKLILVLADKVIVTSTEIKERLEKIIDKSKIIYIPNGVDLNLFRVITKKKAIKILNVLYIGRLEKQKNLTILIKAMATIKSPYQLTFFGQGSQKKELTKLANKLNVSLIIKDPVEYIKLPEILSDTDIFVLPSQEEGSPKILLEAMACQKAVVGSNVKGISEIIIHDYNGLLTNPDPKGIANAIKKLDNKSTRERLGENARKYISKNYEIHSLLDKEVELLKKAAVKK